MSLNSKQFHEALNNVFKFLDNIDLRPYIIQFKHETVYDLMEVLNKNYPYKDQYSEFLFDAVNESEFVDYLNERYGLNIRETTVSYYYI